MRRLLTLLIFSSLLLTFQAAAEQPSGERPLYPLSDLVVRPLKDGKGIMFSYFVLELKDSTALSRIEARKDELREIVNRVISSKRAIDLLGAEGEKLPLEIMDEINRSIDGSAVINVHITGKKIIE